MSETRHARQRRDQKMADDAGEDRSLMCTAPGCPNLWSNDFGKGRNCSAHGWSSRRYWPQITQEQIDAQTQRALVDAAKIGRPEKPALSKADKRALLSDMASLSFPSGEDDDKRAWARKLRARERRVDRMTAAQKSAWREALHFIEQRHDGLVEEEMS